MNNFLWLLSFVVWILVAIPHQSSPHLNPLTTKLLAIWKVQVGGGIEESAFVSKLLVLLPNILRSILKVTSYLLC